MMPEENVSKEIYALVQLPDENLFRMEGKRKAVTQELCDRFYKTLQICFIRRCYCKIIGISDIMLHAKPMLYELVKLVCGRRSESAPLWPAGRCTTGGLEWERAHINAGVRVHSRL